MNGLIAPTPPPAQVTRWTRNAEFLVYLVPVGAIPTELYVSYVQLLQACRELPIRSLTRPGGYAAELSPFRSFSWDSPGAIRFRFVSTTEPIDNCDGEDVHACNRPIGVIGICHCPSTPSLKDAYTQFVQSIQHFPGMLVQQCFAFEHRFDVDSVEECASLSNLVMFPVHHELDEGESTVSLHLRVVLDTIAVRILMSLESTIRAAIRQQAQVSNTSSLPFQSHSDAGELHMSSFLLDTNVEPTQSQFVHLNSMPLLSRDSTQSMSSLHPASSAAFSSPSPLASSDSRQRKRQIARQRKLFGDYSVMAHCLPDALEHYMTAIELLKEEERKSGAAGDMLWLAAALEGYAFCLYLESHDKFVVEIVEKTSEAISLYARAGVSDLECLLIENVGWYYVTVILHLAQPKFKGGKDKAEESIWIKRLLWDALDRALALVPDLQLQRQIEFMIQASRMLESIGHRKRMAFFLHEAATLLISRNSRTNVDASATTSPLSSSTQPYHDLRAALTLQRLAADRLGILTDNDAHSSNKKWEITSLYRSKKVPKGKPLAPSSSVPADAWMIIRFHVLRQLLTIAKMLGSPLLIGKFCIQLLELLVWSDSIPSSSLIARKSPTALKKFPPMANTFVPIDQIQQAFSFQRTEAATSERAGLYGKSSVYFTPPSSLETKAKRYFSIAGSPSSTLSSAAASLSSTIANTPRILATPRQQISAAVNAISTKASPAFSSLSHVHHSSHFSGHGISSSNGGYGGIPNGGDVDTGSSNTSADNRDSQSLEKYSDGGIEIDRSAGGGDWRGSMIDVTPVWNLRSKEELVKMEQSLLHMIETECSPLHPIQQTKLRTFLHVDKLRAISKHERPFLSKTKALELYGNSGVDEDTHRQKQSDFFYSPFENQQRRSRTSDNKYDDDEISNYEKGYPVYESIEIEMVISNPLGVSIEVQQASAWVTVADEKVLSNITDSSSCSAAVECYPTSLILAPYEKQRIVALSVRPMRTGTYHVRGCFIRTLNLKTSYVLAHPLTLRVVEKLPVATLSIWEYGSAVLSNGTKPQKLPDRNLRISMFSSEVKQCELRVRNTGSMAITKCRLAVSICKRQIVQKTLVIFNNLKCIDRASLSVADTISQIETGSVILRCRMDRDLFLSKLPIANDDSVVIPFEILLRGRKAISNSEDLSPLEEDEQLQWTFVYSDESDDGVHSKAAADIFYRESKLALKLDSLPSLSVCFASILPCCPDRSRSLFVIKQGDDPFHSTNPMMDHSHCLLVVEVVNPTETVFRFRIRYANSADTDNEMSCGIEIGRKCSRRLAIEIPRLSYSNSHYDRKLSDLLNELVKLEWGTFFGASGNLLFEERMWYEHNEMTMKQELFLPMVSFEVSLSLDHSSPQPITTRTDIALGSARLPYPFQFFRADHLCAQQKTVNVNTLEFISFTFHVHKHIIDESKQQQHQIFQVDSEIMITQDGQEVNEIIDDQVIIAGVIENRVQWDNEDRTKKCIEIQCLFLTEGIYYVTMRGRVVNCSTEQSHSMIWCSQPLYVHAKASETMNLSNI